MIIEIGYKNGNKKWQSFTSDYVSWDAERKILRVGARPYYFENKEIINFTMWGEGGIIWEMNKNVGNGDRSWA